MNRFGLLVLLSFSVYVRAQQSEGPDEELLVEYMKYVKKGMDIIKKAIKETSLEKLKKQMHDLFELYLSQVPDVEWMRNPERVDDFAAAMRDVADELGREETRKQFKHSYLHDNAKYLSCLARSDAGVAMANLRRWYPQRHSLIKHARLLLHRCAYDYLKI